MRPRRRQRFGVGQLVRPQIGAGFAVGQTCTVLEVLPGDRVRIAYGSVSDLIVAADKLVSL